MDFALFMERYGYRFLFGIAIAVVLVFVFSPWVVYAYYVIRAGGAGMVMLLTGVFVAVVLITVGKDVLFNRLPEVIYAHRQSPMKKEVRKIEDSGK